MSLFFSFRGSIGMAARRPSGGDFGTYARYYVGVRALLCRRHHSELEILLHPPYRFFTSDYSLFDSCGMASSEAPFSF
jgi:hypothetical protein